MTEQNLNPDALLNRIAEVIDSECETYGAAVDGSPGELLYGDGTDLPIEAARKVTDVIRPHLASALPAQPDTVSNAARKRHDGWWWIESANINDWEDCTACAEHEYDLCPVHHGMVLGQQQLSKALTRICEDNSLLDYLPLHEI